MNRNALGLFAGLTAAIGTLLLPAPRPALGQDAAEAAGGLRIGWAMTDITPEQPVMLVGSANPPVSEGVADPIFATVLVLESAGGRRPADVAVMVSVDLCLFSDDLVERVRAMTGELAPEIDPAKILLSATHTHVAPGTHTASPQMGEKLKELGLELPSGWAQWGLG